jgi:hypothetical protein
MVMVEQIGKMTVCEKVVDSLRHAHVHVDLMRLGIAIAHIVHTCTNIGTLKAAAICVASVPPSPGMMRSVSKNAGDPTLKRRTHAGSFSMFLSSSRRCDVRRAIAYPAIAANTSPTALTTEPQSGPKITPFMIARASVTENGADATTVKSNTASGYATQGPIVVRNCSTAVF